MHSFALPYWHGWGNISGVNKQAEQFNTTISVIYIYIDRISLPSPGPASRSELVNTTSTSSCRLLKPGPGMRSISDAGGIVQTAIYIKDGFCLICLSDRYFMVDRLATCFDDVSKYLK